MMRRIALPLFGMLVGWGLFAQPVISNIYLFDIQKKNEREIQFSNPVYLTEFNSKGYNNQPTFISSGELFFTAQYPNEKQTDIYLLDLYRKTKSQVTQTLESEYSPSVTPDRFSFSAVRVEADGTQRLWQFPVDRLSNGKPVFKYVSNVGYFQWLNSQKIALFLTGDEPKLAIADVRTDEVRELTRNIGRCLKVVPRTGNLAFVHKVTPRTWYIKSMNIYDPNFKSDIITTTLPGSEDFVILDDGTYLMGSGSKLFKYHPVYDNEKGWRELADFRYYGIKNITRLALSQDGKLALVNEEK
jgi:hypothetical protein